MEQNNVSFQNVKTGEPLSQKEIDEMFMRRCLQLAKNGRENAKPNPCLLYTSDAADDVSWV